MDPAEAYRDCALVAVLAYTGIRQDGEVLKPHGAQRGLGTELYQGSAEVSQSVLRHKSIDTTHRSYNKDDTAQTRKAAESILNGDSADEE